MAAKELKVAAVILVSLVVGFLLAGGSVLPKASGQGEGMTQGVMVVVGDAYAGYAPIVLMDIPDQSILVYEYSYSARQIKLTSARTYRFDKLLTDFQTGPPTVDQVRGFVTR